MASNPHISIQVGNDAPSVEFPSEGITTSATVESQRENRLIAHAISFGKGPLVGTAADLHRPAAGLHGSSAVDRAADVYWRRSVAAPAR